MPESLASGCRSVALLVFLAAAARAGSLRPTFGSSRLTVLITSSPPVRAGAVRCRRHGALPCRRRRRRPAAANAGSARARRLFVVIGRLRRAVPRHGGSGRRLFVQHRPQPAQVADDLFLDPRLHVLEQREAFLLVLDQRIALAVAAQADAFLQVIERVEVVLPLRSTICSMMSRSTRRSRSRADHASLSLRSSP